MLEEISIQCGFLESITVKSVIARGTRLEIGFECKGQVEKFLTGNRFFAEYNVPIDSVPEPFLLIPFLSTACPIAWDNHANIYVNNIDERYLDSLKQIQTILSNLLPKIGFSGNIYAEKTIAGMGESRPKSMVLFSGGIDSLATYIRHKEENPLLLTVQGADIPLKDSIRWEAATREIDRFAKRNDLEDRTISSNFYDVRPSHGNCLLQETSRRYLVGFTHAWFELCGIMCSPDVCG